METSNEVKILSMLGEVNNKLNSLEVELKGEINGVREELKEEINGVREELKGEISGVREELKGEISGVREELKGEINGVKEELNETKVELKGMKEIMFKNFAALADTQVTTYNKLNEISDSLKNIEFRVGVTEAGVSLNAKEIQGIRNI